MISKKTGCPLCAASRRKKRKPKCSADASKPVSLMAQVRAKLRAKVLVTGFNGKQQKRRFESLVDEVLLPLKPEYRRDPSRPGAAFIKVRPAKRA